jgi:hypothetical protein
MFQDQQYKEPYMRIKSKEKIEKKPVEEKKRFGGPQPGSGRKPSSLNKKTREIAEKAAEKGITPLEVMLEAMNDAYKISAIEAFPYAKDAAPFMHARINSVEWKGDLTIKGMTDEEVDKKIRSLAAQLLGGA